MIILASNDMAKSRKQGLDLHRNAVMAIYHTTTTKMAASPLPFQTSTGEVKGWCALSPSLVLYSSWLLPLNTAIVLTQTEYTCYHRPHLAKVQRPVYEKIGTKAADSAEELIVHSSFGDITRV